MKNNEDSLYPLYFELELSIICAVMMGQIAIAKF